MSVDAFISQFSELTEEYTFYAGEVTLHYEPQKHQYLLSENGELTPVDGVTSTCKIIDKSFALIPWSCRMMASKILSTVPTQALWPNLTQAMSLEDFQKFVLDCKDAHKEKLEEAGDIGHTAHAWVERYIKAVIAAGKDSPEVKAIFAKLPEDEKAANACRAALDWMGQHKVHWLGTERKIYHRTHRYAGTMDGLCYVSSCSNPDCCKEEFKNRLTISDWKTSNYLYIEYLLQTAAYQEAYNDEMEHVWFNTKPRPALDDFPWPVSDRWIIRLGKDDGDFQAWHASRADFDEDWAAFKFALDLKRTTEGIDRRVKDRANVVREAVKARRKADKEAEEQAERERKAAEKEQQRQARAEALKFKCPKADKYKGVRPPRCNDGHPCLACRTKYAIRNGLTPPPCLFDYTGPCDGDHASPVCGSLHCWRAEYETRPERLLSQGS
jgi:hypothetical protein